MFLKKRAEKLTTPVKRVRLLTCLATAGLGLSLLTVSPGLLTARAELGEASTVEGCAVMIDGERAVVLASGEEAQAVLDTILKRASTPATEVAAFSKTVSVEPCQVREDEIVDAEDALALLDPKEGNAPLTVLTQETWRRTESVPYATETVLVEDGYSDEVELLQKGRDGEQVNTYSVILRDGEPILETLKYTIVTAPVVDEVISQGALPGSRTDSKGFYIWPTTGVISSGFGGRSVKVGSSNHQGLDIANSDGTDIVAADGGTVIYAQRSSSGYGNLIKIRHDDGSVTYYGHLQEILVEEGEKVAQGQLIGKMGRTGVVTGSHLHFEIRPDGSTPVNPLPRMTGELQKG